ncbi:MAG TPA: hypothetical protein VGE55_11645 [Limnobacter sp.]|uniref:hypothetical protein n=1 Tax=Limnobacter sp. TaxID=2003368 RepID=UPI002EDA346F
MMRLDKPQVVLAHGWAYTPQFFKPWLTLLATEQPELFASMDWCVLDSGYNTKPTPSVQIGDIRIPCLPSNTLQQALQHSSICVGIGHSMGFAKLLDHCLPEEKSWAHLVSLNGFTYFASTHPDQPGTPLRVLQRMLRRAQQDLPTVVEDFQTRSGGLELQDWNTQALLQDLEQLIALNCSMRLHSAQAMGTHIHCVYNTDDAIVPHNLTAGCFSTATETSALPGPHSDLMVAPHRYTSTESAVVEVLNQARTAAQANH